MKHNIQCIRHVRRRHLDAADLSKVRNELRTRCCVGRCAPRQQLADPIPLPCAEVRGPAAGSRKDAGS
jgi:hypothetical protein